jgi:hypothetical protein
MLGGDTPENAQRLEQFKQEQDEAKLRLKTVKTRVAEHSRFALAEDGSTATSAAGMTVEFLDLVDASLTAGLNPHERTAPLRVTGLLHEPTPTFREMVIDQDGSPLEVTVPDPRVFAAHQYLLAEDGEQDSEARTQYRYLAEAVTEALRAKRLSLPPLEPFPEISDTARLGAILHDDVLAGKQEVHR